MLPQYGLSFHKPSTLWPPPPDDLTVKVHEGIRSKIREYVFGKDGQRHNHWHGSTPPLPTTTDGESRQTDHEIPMPNSDGATLHLGSTASLPLPNPRNRNQTIDLLTADGQQISVEQQIHLYTTNDLLTHPLVSSVLSYMGGLPPLQFIASDKEVLRDEVIYMSVVLPFDLAYLTSEPRHSCSAHKAAHPEKYPLRDTVRQIYPPLKDIEDRCRPTQVHLQVYDGTFLSHHTHIQWHV